MPSLTSCRARWLLHVSQIANERVNKVDDYIRKANRFASKVLEQDDKGRFACR